ncbi:hypothetical protein SAMN06295885_3516 [Rathayibacter oskolensis]|uniref:Camelysin metallo-endopeptidase n=1 Tax=Rathayibacter oskolensis TaxID=1891671 RepID=A0A1X7PG56_9MICO|nr:hypothetical protein [Rathayibacter oskolensis]SMH50384.1 hypothetical protein SAMN06295885_3516 [Rathayibacter oskolensis]
MSGAHRAARRRRSPRALVAIGAGAALVLGAAAGAAALFDARDTATAGVGAGVVTAEFDATGVTNLSVPVTGLVPGGSDRRLLDLTNAGTVTIAALQLETAAPVVGGSASDGVQLALERCSVAWSADGASCAGTVTTVSPDRPASGRIDLPGSPALAVGATDHLRLTVRLPESAPSGVQGTSGALSVSVTGVQGPGRQR